MRKSLLLVLPIATLVAWPAGAAGAGGVGVTVTAADGGFRFQPATVSIADGGTVTWTNASGAPHTVTRCTPAACSGTDGGNGTDSSFANGNLASTSGATFGHTFQGIGAYNYYCAIHGYLVMHGTVVVTAASATTTAAAPTTTAAPAPTTTAAAAPTTAAAASPPTTTATVSGGAAPSTSTAAPPAPSAPRQLARTGRSTMPSLLAALALIVVGAAAVLVGSRRSRRSSAP